MVPAESLPRLTSAYRMDREESELLDQAVDSPFRELPRALSGGGGWDNLGNGGLVLTAGDFGRLLQMLLNGGELDGVRLLGSKTVELMLYNHLASLDDPNSFWPGVGYGMGFAVLYDREQYGEAGSNGMIWWAGSATNTGWISATSEAPLGTGLPPWSIWKPHRVDEARGGAARDRSWLYGLPWIQSAVVRRAKKPPDANWPFRTRKTSALAPGWRSTGKPSTAWSGFFQKSHQAFQSRSPNT